MGGAEKGLGPPELQDPAFSFSQAGRGFLHPFCTARASGRSERGWGFRDKERNIRLCSREEGGKWGYGAYVNGHEE